MFSTEFYLTSLIVVLVPGAGVIYTVSTGLARGWRASIVAAFGCTMGIIPHLAASILGLSAVLHMKSWVLQGIKYAGALYLLYMAWSMWRETGTLNFAQPDEYRNSYLRIIINGILINLLNPKLTLFFFAFLPQFIAPDLPNLANQLLGLGGIFMAMTLVIFMLYGLLASSVSVYFSRSPKAARWMQRSFALVFAILAVDLVLSSL